MNIDSFPNFEDPNAKVQLPVLPTLEVRELPSFVLPSTPSCHRQIMVDACQACDKVKWMFLNTFYELEEETMKSVASLNIPVYPIGPLVSEFMFGEEEEKNNVVGVNMWDVQDSCIEWLDKNPPSSVIYLSFGSVVVLSQQMVENIATALKNSNRAFLWVIRPPKKGFENEADAVYLPLGFLEETKERGLVVKWCQQEKVLMHPSVACFVSHCGWNSMLEAVVAGVPVIGYPMWLDHPLTAKLVVNKFQNGVVMNRGEHGVDSVEEIDRCIKEVMEGTSARKIKQRAMEVKEVAIKALEEGGSSDKSLNQFVNDMINADNSTSA